MSKKNSHGIEVYLRVRPAKKLCQNINLEADENKIAFTFTRDGAKSGN